VKGDRVEIVVDVGGGTKTYEVSEMTRTGNVVRTGRFMATRVVAVIEHPALDEEPARRARVSENQSSLL
jgi:hypothetical protein